MAENYKHLYEQMKLMVEKYQDEIVPGLRKAIENLEAERRWISVEDRLPEDERSVLVRSKHRCLLVGRYFPQFKRWHCAGNVTVTHWVPIPEPPGCEN